MKKITLYFKNGDKTYEEGIDGCIKISDSRDRDTPIVKIRFEASIMKVFKGVPFMIELVESSSAPEDEYNLHPGPAKRPGYFR